MNNEQKTCVDCGSPSELDLGWEEEVIHNPYRSNERGKPDE